MNEALISDLFAKLQAFITKPLPVLEDELRQAASQAAFQLSASNYETIFQTLSFCFVTPLSEEETCTNIGLFEHLCLNITRLSGLFDRINRNIANFKKSTVQFTLAKALHKVIWNWINNYPMQFVTICQQCAKIPGSSPFHLFIFNNKMTDFLIVCVIGDKKETLMCCLIISISGRVLEVPPRSRTSGPSRQCSSSCALMLSPGSSETLNALTRRTRTRFISISFFLCVVVEEETDKQYNNNRTLSSTR